MEKLISNFKIKNHIQNGNFTYNITCPMCKSYVTVNTIHKLNKEKIKVVKCQHCGNSFKVGDIYNFSTGKTLYNRLNKRFTTTIYDRQEWSIDGNLN